MIQRVNLIPDELRLEKSYIRFPVKYFIVVILGILYILPIHIRIEMRLNEIDKKRENLERKKLELVTNNMRFAALKNETEKIINKTKLIKKTSKALTNIIKERVYWSDILKEASFLVPKDLWLSNFSSRNVTIDVESSDAPEKTIEKTYKEVTIKGEAYKNKSIKEFIENLEGSYFLDDIKLNFIKKRIINKIFKVYEFEVVSKIKEKNE